MVEPHDAALDNDDDCAVEDGELASLVRRWVGARRSGAVRVAPIPATTASDPGDRGDDAGAELAPEAALDPAAELAVEPAVEPDVPLGPGDVDIRYESDGQAPRLPVLPHRASANHTQHDATRLAVLIDARRTSEDVAAGLMTRLGDRGSVNVCRAYADWRRSDLGSWVERLRRAGLHSFHQFADGDDQALVALALDAVDIAREASVDEVVLAGDMTSMLPLVHRLHGAGVRVVVVGPGHTPHDVRAACDEFHDEDSLLGGPAAPAGRHRA